LIENSEDNHVNSIESTPQQTPTLIATNPSYIDSATSEVIQEEENLETRVE
jgi:hypothetical protein